MAHMRIPKSASLICAALTFALLAATTLLATFANAQAPSRFVGAVTAISGTTLTVKTDAGQSWQVVVPAEALIKRVEPGQKDLSTAQPMQFSDLAVADRVLVKLDPDAPAGAMQALQIVAVKRSDLAAKHQKDREDWQRRGVGGLVKSVDAPGGVIVLTSGAGPTAKAIVVNIGKETILKRYSPASVSFDAAVVAPIDAIHAGDQLRARGTKSADGSSIQAEEVVSGTFRYISGIISSLDAAASTLTLKDLATKKPVTIHITADAQMRSLPANLAAMLAARLKGTAGSGSGGSAGGSNGGARPAGGAQAPPQGAPPAGAGGGGHSQWSSQGSGQAGGGTGSGDSQQILSRAPVIQFADLKKGDAIMVVSTDGAADVTAITLVSGVEPLLEAPAASQSLLNNWSMGSSSPDAGAQ